MKCVEDGQFEEVLVAGLALGMDGYFESDGVGFAPRAELLIEHDEEGVDLAHHCEGCDVRDVG